MLAASLILAAVGPGQVSAQSDPVGTTPASSTTTTAPPSETPSSSTTTPGVVAEPEGTPQEQPAPRRPDRSELIPPPIDLSSLDQLMAGRRAEATAGAQAVADAMNAEALARVVAVRAELDGALAEVPTLDAAVAAARSAERAAAAALERSRSRLSELAVESYTLALTGRDAVTNSSTGIIQSMDGFEDFVATSEYSGAAWQSLTVGENEAALALAATEAATALALDARTALEGRIGAARVAEQAAVSASQEVAAQGVAAVAEAARIGEGLAVDGLGPTILGETVIGPADLAAFSAQRAGASSSVDLLALAMYFVAEGEAEGVRADIAWAQSILETGNFGYRGSMVSTSDNNYAGIGACDSCTSGFRYASPQMGARAQMQLLRAYADDNLTTDRLGNPPVGRPPERVGVRGCCDTWMELSGVWATGPGYGVKILTLYNEMLSFAAARQRQAAGAT